MLLRSAETCFYGEKFSLVLEGSVYITATDVGRKFIFLFLARFHARPIILAFTTQHFHRKASDTRLRGEVLTSG